MIKPDAYMEMGKVIDMVYAAGFKLNRMKMSRFTNATASQFFGQESSHMTSDVSIGMELVANDAVAAWKEAMGPIRARFGADEVKNAVHGSES
jgi:nucleoside diphosphate kinase